MSNRLIDVLYEDESCVAFNKPAGLLVVPTPKQEKDTLVDIVNRQQRAIGSDPKLFPCHRLDRDTSGVILFAKGKKNQQVFMQQFKEGRVKKKYIAIVHGKLKQRAGEIKGFIRDWDQLKYQRHAPAKWALTRYKVLDVHKRFSVLEVIPLTGRTNQIRIHFSQIGHPLVGERKYAVAHDFTVKFRRTALHALELAWYHPLSKQLIRVQAPWPKDMKEFFPYRDFH